VAPLRDGFEQGKRGGVPGLWCTSWAGTRSAAGSRSVEMVLTAVTTSHGRSHDGLAHLIAASGHFCL